LTIKYSLYIVLAFLIISSARGQEKLSISGRIMDADKDTPLLFAQIALSNSTIGTVSNEEGQFFLGIPENHLNDTLVITFLGYEPVRMPVSGLINKNNLFRLKSKEVELKEVEVIALTPEEVIRRAFYRISENYGGDSLVLTAFYRSQKYAGKKLAEFAEAIIEDLKTGYFPQNTIKELKQTASHSNIPHLVKGRVVSDTNLVNSMGDVGKMAGCLGCIFSDDFVEFSFRSILDEKIFRSYSLKMEEIINPEGGKIYHILFEQSVKNAKLYQGELFIDGSSFAIMKIRLRPSFKAYDQYEKGKYRKTYTINNTSGWIAEMPLIDKTIIYSKRVKGWYLSTIHDEQWVTFTLPSTGQKIRMGYKNDLVVTDVTRDPERIRNYHGSKKIGVNQRWDQIAGPPDENFWASFNYLPIEERLKKEISEIK
jgi:hypothetical protein